MHQRNRYVHCYRPFFSPVARLAAFATWLLIVAPWATRAADPSVPPSPAVDDGASGRFDSGVLLSIPEGTPIQRHEYNARGNGAPTSGGPATTTGSPLVVYSNTAGTLVYPPGAGRRIADDLFTLPSCNCDLASFEFTVGGGDGSGPGFSVDFALYETCPGSGGTIVPGTEGTMAFPVDGLHVISVDISGLNLPKRSSFWLATQFSRNGVGWVVGAPAEIGFSSNFYDHPISACTATFGATTGIYAAFNARLTCVPSVLTAATLPNPVDGAAAVPLAPVLKWGETGQVASSTIPPTILDGSWIDKLPPGQHCATMEHHAALQAEQGSVAGGCPTNGTCDVPGTRDFFIPSASTLTKTIRLSFRVFCEDDGSNCALTQQQVDNQVQVLRADYAPWEIDFSYDTAFINDSTFRFFQSNNEAAMKNTYAESPQVKLNIFVVSTTGFSFGYFPWGAAALEHLGGIVLHDGHVFPNAHILSHEIGHNVGLWHTHHGVSEVGQCSACYERADGLGGDTSGDFCSDTPGTPVNFDCSDPPGEDFCSQTPWSPTSTQNFMSYAPSFCQWEFSAQQAGRFQCWIDTVLSSWLDTGECDALFDVYGGLTSPPTDLLCADTPQKQCFAGSLPDSTDYFWNVVTKRGEEQIEGPIWSFTTAEICSFGGSVPASCQVDARQPHELGDANARQGWDSFTLTMACTTASLTAADFSVQVQSGPAPSIVGVTHVGDQVTLSLSGPIPPGQWTCITYDISGQQACWGSLPGDANGDGVSEPSDILALIDALNGIVSIPDRRLDMDRSGAAGPEDILRLIDLLNGAAAFEPWLDATLGPCPAGP